jgi:hypothetical protein
MRLYVYHYDTSLPPKKIAPVKFYPGSGRIFEQAPLDGRINAYAFFSFGRISGAKRRKPGYPLQ